MSNKPNEQEEKVVLEKDAASFEENYIDENIIADKSSKTREFIKKFLKRKTAVAAFAVMVFLLIIAIIGPSLAPYDPSAYDYDNILAPPIAEHWFGTDQFGQDIFSRILAGAPLTLGVSLSSVVVGAALGTVLGLLAGYYGGWIEMLVMRGADVLFSFPDILLAIAIVAAAGFGLSALLRRGGLGLAMGLTALLYFAGLLVNLDQGLDWLRFLTPYYYADAARLFAGETQALPVLTGCALGALGAGLGLWWYGRKDIAA